MPFAEAFDAVYAVVKAAARQALPDEIIECKSLKEVHAGTRITDDIVDALQGAALCIADLTGNNANVMWETGYAMALGKPVVLIGQNVESLPFDLRVHRITPYSPEALQVLSGALAEAVRQTLARFETLPATQVRSAARGGRTIVVTGSGLADPARARRRIETLLEPYLDRDAIWYCGTTGTVDETAVDYLLAKKQRVVAVAYHRYDFSDHIRVLIEKGKLPLIDASVEPVSKHLAGAHARDAFFAAKGDLVVLFWDGKSRNTGTLVTFFQENGNNLLLGYV